VENKEIVAKTDNFSFHERRIVTAYTRVNKPPVGEESKVRTQMLFCLKPELPTEEVT
jgi:hypothetical protein